MRSFLKLLLAIITLGIISTGCGQQSAEMGPRVVTLVVPGMF